MRVARIELALVSSPSAVAFSFVGHLSRHTSTRVPHTNNMLSWLILWHLSLIASLDYVLFLTHLAFLSLIYLVPMKVPGSPSIQESAYTHAL
jgi:hypothetical protein